MKRLAMVLAGIALIACVYTLAVQAATQAEVKEAPVTWRQVAEGDGQTLYVELCAACHGVGGAGDGPAAPALAKPLPDLTQLAAGNGGVFPADAVKKTIRGEASVAAHGSLEMPIWGKVFRDVRPDKKMGQREVLAQARIDDLTRYLESIQASESKPAGN
jgi:mono/diheme cytochrome c family protein